MLKSIKIKDKELKLPTFFPDATRGVARSIDQGDLKNASVPGLVVNTYHLMSDPGGSVLKHFKGLKKFMNWDGFLISDSGGFQVFSIIQKNKSLGSINNNGVTFKEKGKSYKFTPEKSIQIQFDIGSDIMIAFDDCPSPDAKSDEVKASVERTIEWAKKSKEEFDRQIEQRRLKENERPLIFGVIQGGNDPKMRELCATELIKIGFDGYGFGGWPLDKERNIDYDILKVTADLMPDDKPKYALGLGNPEAVVACRKMGYDIFDCVLPTRDARHQRLYTFPFNPAETDLMLASKVHSYVYIMEEKYRRDSSPISQYCDCHTCQNYSKAYIQHLFNIGDVAAQRLATIHNLRYYQDLLRYLP